MSDTVGYSEHEFVNSFFVQSQMQRLTVLMDFVHEVEKISNRISGATMMDVRLGW
jgi:hypothetical protein